VQDLCALVTTTTQPAFNIEHATEIAKHYRRGDSGAQVVAFTISNVRGNLAELDRKSTAEAATRLSLVHFVNL
jgi:hypothetical protein